MSAPGVPLRPLACRPDSLHWGLEPALGSRDLHDVYPGCEGITANPVPRPHPHTPTPNACSFKCAALVCKRFHQDCLAPALLHTLVIAQSSQSYAALIAA